MNIIEYLNEVHDYRITSNPHEYRESYPNGKRTEFGLRNYYENGRNMDAYCNGYHRAFDLSKHDGADVPSVADGVVIDGTRSNGTFGGQVVVMYEDLGVQVIYGHVKTPLIVKVGQKVKQGETIAYQGSTNNQGVSMSSHLHLQTQPIKAMGEFEFTCSGIDPLKIDVNKKGSAKVSKGRERLNKKIPADIGHGINTFPANGKGVFKNGKGYAEFSFNNKLAKRIKPLLEHNGFDVPMAQPFDSNDVGLVQRTNYYDAQGSDLGMSLHANAGTVSVGGRCVFYWATSAQGKRFAELIIKNMAELGYKFHGVGLHASNYNSWTNLHMVRECTTFPMVLIEHGFMTNNLDFPLIFGNRQNQYIKDMAEANVKSVCEYFGVSFLDLDEDVEQSTGSSSGVSGSDLYRVQVGAFGQKANAVKMAKEIEAKNMTTYTARDNDENIYRVQVGAFGEKKNAENQLKKLKDLGYADAFIANNDGYVTSNDDGDVEEPVPFEKYKNRGRTLDAHYKGKIDNLGAEVRKRRGSRKTGFNWNEKAGYDLKSGDTVYIFEVHDSWGRIYTGNQTGKGSNDWVYLDRVEVTEVF